MLALPSKDSLNYIAKLKGLTASLPWLELVSAKGIYCTLSNFSFSTIKALLKLYRGEAMDPKLKFLCCYNLAYITLSSVGQMYS